MKIIIEIFKFIIALMLIPYGLTFWGFGIFCLYGGPEGNVFGIGAFAGTAIGIGMAIIMALIVLWFYQFNKKLVLILLILHEIILFLFLAMMVVATAFSKDIPQIMMHPVVLAGVLAGGYVIFKTIKAIKAENGNNIAEDRKTNISIETR